ncbi:hypothetical protein E2C01_097537 [Portunus trituberculatus]|uniref:Uncharacterized protein n=1 Tax=Portunus trituberculatus TaxID=210409 RepID=A0A5B7K5Z4_PORTR|nr:hypothetical protein [Portunus trituberculatus]
MSSNRSSDAAARDGGPEACHSAPCVTLASITKPDNLTARQTQTNHKLKNESLPAITTVLLTAHFNTKTASKKNQKKCNTDTQEFTDVAGKSGIG